MSTPAWTAAERAFEDVRVLFPFRLERWFLLGSLAFLDQCGSANGVLSPAGGSSWGGQQSPDFSAVRSFTASHIALIVGITAIVLAVLVLWAAVATWIGSRGTFMYLEAVSTGRLELGRMWRENAEHAQSLFQARFLLSLVALLAVFLILFVAFAVVSTDLRGPVQALALVSALGIVVVLALILVAAGVCSWALRDFAAPIQRKQGVPCWEAIVRLTFLVRAHPGEFLIYGALKLGYHGVLSVAGLLVCCVCCCLLVPVLLQTALQPFFFFGRAFSLRFLEEVEKIGGVVGTKSSA